MTKLPFGRLARHAYLDVIGNLRGLARIGGPWLLLSWALLLLGQGGSPLFAAAADVALTLGVAAIATGMVVKRKPRNSRQPLPRVSAQERPGVMAASPMAVAGKMSCSRSAT